MLVILGMSGCETNTKKTTTLDKPIAKEDIKTPSLTVPKVRKVWVPEKIEGDKYIEGHWMWVLERSTTWSQ